MAKSNTTIYTHNLTYYAWQRFKRNKLSLFSLIFIGFFVLISFLGYLITPDSTPNANDQKLEIAVKPIGFTCREILIRNNAPSKKRFFILKMLIGEENDFKSTPYFDAYLTQNDLIYEEYTGKKNNAGNKIKYNLADIAYAIDYSKPFDDNPSEGYVDFYDMDSKKQIRKTTNELQEIVLKNNLIERTYYLGTDRVGRDMLSRIIIGTRISIAVGAIAVALSLFIGVVLGALSGYFRGWVDNLIMLIVNIVWSIPTLLLVIAITLALGKGFWQVFVAVGLTMWVEVARVVRGQVISLREKEFIEAGRSLGFTHFRIILNHILPNISGTIIVLSAVNFANAILIEAGLSFLGIGAQPPIASWGAMINAHRGYIITNSAYLAFLPGFAIMLMVLSFVLVGNGLRDAFDTKSVDDISV